MNEGSQLRFWRTARTLERLRLSGKSLGARRSDLPTVFFITDPDRTPDPVAIARRLPRGAGIIYRGFGRGDSETVATALVRVARARGLVLLIGANAELALRVGASGVHLPERDVSRARRVKALDPRWMVTVAAHSPMALARAKTSGADAALYSAIFPSRSASAGTAIGPVKLGLAIRGLGLPVFALGGVNPQTAKSLIGTGVAGFAAVEAFASPE